MLFLTVSCGSLSDPINGRVTTTGTTLSSIATYTCDTGYTRSGDMTRTCQANRDWTGSEPSCNREYSMTINNQIQINFCCLAVDCGSLDALSNGAVDTSSGTTFMMTATYTCNTGYTLIGANTRTCGIDGQWTPDAPTCLRTQVISNINCMFTLAVYNSCGPPVVICRPIRCVYSGLN